jgi:DNA-binding GntR family transcriptional regulator
MARPTKAQQIATSIRNKVLSGELLPGDKLPSHRKLATEYATSRQTVDGAVQMLVADGTVEPSDRNRPHVIADIKSRMLTVADRAGLAAQTGRALAKNERTEILFAGWMPCPPDIAVHMEVEPGTPVICRERVNYIDDQPMATGRSFYPPEVSEKTPELAVAESMPSGSRELAIERMGSPMKKRRILTTGRVPTEQEMESLGLPSPYTPVLQALRIVRLKNGKIVEVATKVQKGSIPLVANEEV